MIDDPDLRRTRRTRADAIDFDRLDELAPLDDALDAADDDANAHEVPWRQSPSAGARRSGRPRGGTALVGLLRPWLDPRPGELRGLIVVLTAGLVLTTALWFDASRRPGVLETAGAAGAPDAGFAAVTPVGGDGGEAWSGEGPAGDPWGVQGTAVAADVLVIHVSGAVGEPGLVTLPPGARVGDAVVAAGGAYPDAQLDRVNLARPVVDGEQIHVPRVGEDAPPPAGAPSRGVLPDGRIDLNLASAEELERLPGIGPARAQAIIAAREEQPFRVPGDLRRVSGIGEATFQRLAPLVAVG
jgi:competence protein ComEA